jgi:2-polyprenyl-3-methyl-5-hydroxy-6-metoxy-1,4-benzoquinol methylase
VSLDTGKHFDFKEFEITSQLLTQLDHSEVFSKLRNILDQSKIRQEWNQVLSENRSQMLANWLRPHITGNVLDVLCGDGMVGNQLAKLGFNVTLSERYFDYDFDRRTHHLSFFPYEELGEIKEVITFDTVLISAMLHHEVDNVDIIELVKAFKSKRIIIIENPLEKQFNHHFHILWDLFFNQ